MRRAREDGNDARRGKGAYAAPRARTESHSISCSSSENVAVTRRAHVWHQKGWGADMGTPRGAPRIKDGAWENKTGLYPDGPRCHECRPRCRARGPFPAVVCHPQAAVGAGAWRAYTQPHCSVWWCFSAAHAHVPSPAPRPPFPVQKKSLWYRIKLPFRALFFTWM